LVSLESDKARASPSKAKVPATRAEMPGAASGGQQLELRPPDKRTRPPEPTLLAAFGVYAPERIEPVTLIDAVIAFANCDVTPAGAAADRVQDARAFAREMLSAAAQWIEHIETPGWRITLTGIGPLMSWTALHGAAADQVHGQLVFKQSWRRDMISRKADPGSQIAWQLKGPNDPKPWIAFAAKALALRSSGHRTEVGHCQLATCGRFFRVIIKGRGKPARDYCPNTNHRQQAQPKSTPRANRSRERKRRELEEAKRTGRRMRRGSR
jgi:hypothetical protein